MNKKILADLPVIPATEFCDWIPHAEQSEKEEAKSVPHSEQRYLQAVHDQPGLPSTEYTTLARVSDVTSAKIRKKFKQQGFIQEVIVKKGKGRPPLLLEITTKGKIALKEYQ